MKLLRCLGALLLLFVVVGCGGGGGGGGNGGGSDPTRAAYRVSVAWPERTRAANAPDTANSVVIEGTYRQEVSRVTANRPAGVAASTSDYVATTTLPTGNITLRLRFYSQANGQGQIVGRAEVVVGMNGQGLLTNTDGTSMSSIQFTTALRSVEVPVGQTVAIGETKDLVATARSESGAVAVLDPGAYTFSVTQGSEFLTSTPSGTATGVAEGIANVRASVDNIFSTPTSVEVTTSVPHGFSIDVAWPARTRAVSGLNSALSVRLSLQKGDQTTTNVVDRPSTLDAIQQAVGAPESPQGAATLGIRFYSQAGGQGVVVGQADVQVMRQANGELTQPNGSPLGAIAIAATVKSVTIAGELMLIHQTKELVATARAANGDVVPVTPGSFAFTLQSGGNVIELTPDGQATGKNSGVAYAVAKIDGATSPAVDISVWEGEPSVLTLDIGTYDLAYDATRDVIWAVTTGHSNPAESLVMINPTTGAITPIKSYFLGVFSVAVSADGQYVYFALGLGDIRRYEPATGEDTLRFTMEPKGASRMHVLPGTNKSLAISHGGGSGTPDSITTIFDDRTARPDSVLIGPHITMNESGTQFFGYLRRLLEAPLISKASVGLNGLTINAQTTSQRPELPSGMLHYSDDRLWADSGEVFDASALTPITQIPLTGQRSRVLPIKEGKRLAVFDYQPNTLSLFDTTTYERRLSFGLPLVEVPYRVIQAGPGRLAFNYESAGLLKTVIVSKLPL